MVRTKLALLVISLLGLIICCGNPFDVEPPHGGWLWIVTNKTYNTGSGIFKMDPVDPSKVKIHYHIPHTYDWLEHFDLAYGDGRLWLLTSKRDDDGVFSHYVWEIGGSYFKGPGVVGLTWDGDYLWGSTTMYNRFYRIDPDTEEYELMFEYKDDRAVTYGLAYDGNRFWVIDRFQDRILCIDPTTGKKVRSVPCPGENPAGLTWDGEALWVIDNGSSNLYRVSPETGRVLGYYTDDDYKYTLTATSGLAFEFPSE